MRKIEFKTAKEMVNWLMDNQGTELADWLRKKMEVRKI